MFWGAARGVLCHLSVRKSYYDKTTQKIPATNMGEFRLNSGETLKKYIYYKKTGHTLTVTPKYTVTRFICHNKCLYFGINLMLLEKFVYTQQDSPKSLQTFPLFLVECKLYTNTSNFIHNKKSDNTDLSRKLCLIFILNFTLFIFCVPLFGYFFLSFVRYC